jgi:hypothetical protein
MILNMFSMLRILYVHTVSSYISYWENIVTACYEHAFESNFLFLVSKKQCRHFVIICLFVNLGLSVDIPFD